MGLIANPRRFNQTISGKNIKSLKSQKKSEERLKELEMKRADLERLKYDVERMNAELRRAIQLYDNEIETIQKRV